MRNSIFVCLVLTGFSYAHAEERTSKSYATCIEKAGGATFALQDCISEELERQDRRLNGAYQVLMDSLPEKRKAQLRDAQRKWIEFRDANCEFYYDPQGGSESWSRSYEQFFRVDKWSLCRG